MIRRLMAAALCVAALGLFAAPTALAAELDAAGALRRVWESALASLRGVLGWALKSAAGVLAAAMLCAVAAPLMPEPSGGLD